MKNKNWFWGIFFIGAAATMILSRYLSSINIVSVFFTIMLVAVIIKSVARVNFSGIFFSIALIGIIYSEPLNIVDLTPWPILITALFCSIGFSILFHKSWHHDFSVNEEHFKEIVNCEDENIVDFRVKFGASTKYVNSIELEKANLSCSFGALKVFFDNTTINPKGAQIYLDISFSGVELYIPKTWNIVNKVDVSLSGIEEKNSRRESDGPTVTLIGHASFSGIEIIYV